MEPNVIIKVARGEDFRKQTGKDIYFDLVDHDKVLRFETVEKLPFALLKDKNAKELGIPVEFQQFWIWLERQNHTYRPIRPLTPHEEANTVGELSKLDVKTKLPELRLFLEVECGQDFSLLPPPDCGQSKVLVFFKLYYPAKDELRYVGRLFVNLDSSPVDEEIELFEEVMSEPEVICDPLDKTTTFHASQIQDGDIICFQKKPTPETKENYAFPCITSFLKYMKFHQDMQISRRTERPTKIRKLI